MYTYTTPQALLTSTGKQVASIQLFKDGSAVATFHDVDAQGNQIGTGAPNPPYSIPAADVAGLWPSTPEITAALYSYLAGKLGWAAGAAVNG